MKTIKSFVRRNSRMTSGNRKQIDLHEGYLCTSKKDIPMSSFVGLEIGFGMGDSLLDVAKKHPNQLWLGIEVYEKGIASVIRQAKENDLTNIRVMIEDTHEVVEQWLPENSIDHIRIFFPDPWPKKRHHKRRLVNKNFLDRLYKILKPTGVIHIATDHLPYAESCIALIGAYPGFKISNRSLERPMTKFAEKAIQKGSLITDIVVEK